MIFKSPYPDISIPEVPIADFVLENASRFSDKPALIDATTDRSLTYQEIADAVKHLAAGLAAHGFGKGDVLAIHALNCPEYAIAFLGVAKLGGVCTMVSPLFNESELSTQLRDSGAKYLLTDPQLADVALAAARTANISRVFAFGETEGAIPFSSLLENSGEAPPVEIDPRSDIVMLPYSSGTTGLPKGVMLTHYNLVGMLSQVEAVDVLESGDTTICVIPCYHMYGLHIVINLALRTGATAVTLRQFDLEKFLRALEKYKVNVVPAVPPIVLALSASPLVERFDLSKLEALHCGAAPLSSEVANTCSERLGVRISFGYGMTELSSLSHLSYRNAGKHKPDSIGYCVPNTFCKIIDVESRQDLKPGEKGEVCIRGPQIMKGYLGQPDATAEIIDSEGWLHTGDIGYADEDGALFIVDRLKELIKYKGRQVAPAELEAVLLSHPAIADAAVIPSPDEKAGEVPIAFVVLKQSALPDEIINFVSERVAAHKRIRRVEFVDEIPKSPAGKILRRLLVQRVREHVRRG